MHAAEFSLAIRSRALLTASVTIVALSAWSAAQAEQQPPVLSAQLSTAQVTVTLPAATISLEEHTPFMVRVAPVSGTEAPVRVRARLGMPMMFHWATEEEVREFSVDAPLEFPSAFPMYGHYRFRVWLDYADGRELKTAVDFTVAQDKPLAAAVVE